MATIVARKRGKKTCYYYHETFRVKVSPADRSAGDKRRGSGPSRVVTREVYLGTPERILERLQVQAGRPLVIRPRQFGLVMTAQSIVEELGIQESVDRLVPRAQGGLSLGTYLSLMVVAKVSAPKVSWRAFGSWLAGTSLSEYLNLPTTLLDAQNFWDAFDRLLPEREARQQTDPEAIWNDETLLAIEEAVWRRLVSQHPIDLSTILIDATNFFTFLGRQTPSRLARPGHNKAGRHDKRQVSLSLAVTREQVFPVVHLTYAGNVTDVRIFSHVLSRLVGAIHRLDPSAGQLTLVFDRGHNSAANLALVAEAGAWAVGGLINSQHPDLLAVPLKAFSDKIGDLKVFRTAKTVYGQSATVLVTHSEALEKKQRLTFDHALARLRSELTQTWERHRNDPDPAFAHAMDTVLSRSRVGTFMTWEVDGEGVVHIAMDRAKVEQHRRGMGRRLLFTTHTDLETAEILRLYNHDKARVEDDFKQLKSPDLARFAPIRHFTDSKIRLYALVCVLALLVLKVMMLRTQDLHLSMDRLVSELGAVQEAIVVPSPTTARHTLMECSDLQKTLVNRFELMRFLPSEP